MLRLALLLAVFASGPAMGADTIRRCQAADGTMVYTDRPCDQLDARPIAPPEPASPPETIERRAPGSTMNAGGALSLGGSTRDDCIRRTDTLLFEVRAAIESRNVNRLAGVYDWAGKSAGAAGNILERLGALVERPAASVEFHYPDTEADAPPAPPVADARPDAVRVLQASPGEIEPSRTVDLRLTRNAACWWVSF